MEWWQVGFVLVMFGLGFVLGKTRGELRAQIARHNLSHFYMTVALDMLEDPETFRESRTVKLVTSHPIYDYEHEEEGE